MAKEQNTLNIRFTSFSNSLIAAVCDQREIISEGFRLQKAEIARLTGQAIDAAEKAAKAAATAVAYNSKAWQEVDQAMKAAGEAIRAAEVARCATTVRQAKKAAEKATKAAETAKAAQAAARKVAKAAEKAEVRQRKTAEEAGKRAVIAQKKAVVKIANNLMFRDGKPEQVRIPRITVKKDGSAIVDLVLRNVAPQFAAAAATESAGTFIQTRQIRIGDVWKAKRTEITGVLWTPELVILNMQDYYNNRTSRDSFLDIEGSTLHVDFEHGAIYRALPDIVDGGVMVFDMTSDSPVDLSYGDLLKMNLPTFGGVRGGQICGSSGMKEKQMILLRNDGAHAAAARQMQEDITVGLSEKLMGRDLTTAQAIKAVTRLGSHLSPEARSAEVDSIAIFGGKYADSKMDGEAWTTLLDEGVASHERGAGTLKAQLIGASPATFKTMLTYLEVKYGVVELVRGSMTEDDKVALDELLMSKSGPFAGKVVRLVKEAGAYPEVFGDLNAFKAPWNYDKVVRICSQGLYDKSRNYQRKVTLGGQIVFKALSVTDAAKRQAFINWFLKEWVSQINDRLDTRNIEIDPEHLEEEFLDMLDNIPSRALYWLNDKAYDYMPWLRRRDFINVVKDLQTAVRKLQVKTSGYYLLAKADPAAFFGLELLAVNEVVLPRVEEDLKKAVMVKYPSMGLNEYMPVHVVPYMEYKDRVMNAVRDGKITQQQGMDILSQVSEARNSIIVSTNGLLVKALAGFDFDTDHIILMTDPFLVNYFFNNVEPVAVMVDTAPIEIADGVTLPAGLDMVAQAFQRFMLMDMKSIGEVTNLWKFIQALYLSDDLNGWKNVVTAGFGNAGKGRMAYTPKAAVKTVNGSQAIAVDGNVIRRMVRNLKGMRLTENNLRASLKDFVMAVPRHDQEITVDGGGHAYRWYVGGGTRWEQQRLFRAVRGMQLIDKKNNLLGEVRLELTRDGQLIKDNTMSDNWSIVKELQNKMLDAIDQSVLPKAIEFAWTQTTDEMFQGMPAKIAGWVGTKFQRDKFLKPELVRCGNLLSTVNRMYAKMIEKAVKSGSEEAKESANEMYETYTKLAETAVRRATVESGPAARFTMVAAMSDANIVSPVAFAGRVSRFGISFLKEETAAWLEQQAAKDWEREQAALPAEKREKINPKATGIDWAFRSVQNLNDNEVVQLWNGASISANTMRAIVRKMQGQIVSVEASGKYLKLKDAEEKIIAVHIDGDKTASFFGRLAGKKWIVQSAFYAGTLKDSEGKAKARQAVAVFVPANK